MVSSRRDVSCWSIVLQNDFGPRSEEHFFQIRLDADYYNRTRTHVSLNKDSPASRAAEPFDHILPVPILGGLHHQYVRI
jgi:hypothetical protein